MQNQKSEENTEKTSQPAVEQPTPKPTEIKPKEPKQTSVQTSTGETHNIILGAFGKKDNAESLNFFAIVKNKTQYTERLLTPRKRNPLTPSLKFVP